MDVYTSDMRDTPYSPLDPAFEEIRLLFFDSPLQSEIISLRHVSWSPKFSRPYTALSYTWRKGGETREILLNGRPFVVEKYLHDALYACKAHIDNGIGLCSSEEEPEDGPWGLQFMWIDALCIDQSNVQERNHQVQRMGSIYSNALKVIVWLGLECESVLRDLHYQPQKCKTLANSFYDADYWSRVWTVQELELARGVWFAAGPNLASLRSVQNFVRATATYRRTHHGTKWLGTHDESIVFRITDRGKLRGLWITELMYMFRDLESHDPRDTLWGLWGLAKKYTSRSQREADLRDGKELSKSDNSRDSATQYIPFDELKANFQASSKPDYTMSTLDLYEMLRELEVVDAEMPRALRIAAYREWKTDGTEVFYIPPDMST